MAAVGEAPTTLDLEQRVTCQTVIEDLAWSKRIWPAENPTPKPSRSQVLSDAAIRAKVETSLRMEGALAERYGQRLDAKTLQIELNRMARNTRAPDVLEERFAALGNDPLTVAECLAKPELVRARLGQAYAFDAKLHGALRERAESALAAELDGEKLTATGGKEQRFVYVREDSDVSMEANSAPLDQIALPKEDFEKEHARLAQLKSGLSLLQVAAGPTSRLRESEYGFTFEQVVALEEKRIDVRQLHWAKQPFETWWTEQEKSWVLHPVVELSKPFGLPAISGSKAASPQAAADTWNVSASPDPRRAHTAVWTGSEMIIWGGTDRSVTGLISGARYDPASDSWTSLVEDVGTPSARTSHIAVWTGTEMIVWGGHGANSFFADGGRYDPVANTWTAVALDGAPEARTFHKAVWTGSEMIVWGGRRHTTLEHLQTGGRYDPINDIWTDTSLDGAPDGRSGHTLVWAGNLMVVWGGNGESSSLSTGGIYDPNENSWKPTSPEGAPTARSYHAAASASGEMIVWGGCVDLLCDPWLANGARFDPVANSWNAMNSLGAPSARFGHTMIWTGTEMIVWGGSPGGGRYDPLSDTWRSLQAYGPAWLLEHTAVWTGTEMLVWGGHTGEFSWGGRYSPSGDQWTPIEAGGGPQISRANAVWTGNEMVIVGNWFNDTTTFAVRYDPATNRWTAHDSIVTLGARIFSSTVWSGTELIVWGGLGALNSGARYNPTIDSWAPTSTTGAPAGRSRHTAVWTGNEMIVWGGDGQGSVTLDSGGLYDPGTDSWSPTPATGAPDPRRRHAAVWAGSEMLIWGGCADVACTTMLDDGAHFDPVLKQWTAMASLDAPSPRYSHSMLWTSSEAIVWGGYDGADRLATGARYEPVAKQWSPTQTTGAPVARSAHTAVWTGSEMIVWGGGNGSGGLASGGRYLPSNNAWTGTEEIGAPVSFGNHVAFWTGNEMLVWMRSDSLAVLGTYYPTDTYRVAGILSGLAGTGLVLQNNGGNALALSDNGSFEFSGLVASGNSYDVSVAAPPANPSQECTVSNGSGTVGSADITDVLVTCVTNTYTVSPAASAGGSIDPNVAQIVEHGQSAVFVLTPDATHFLASVGGSCGGSLQGSTYTTQSVVADCDVSALFEAHTSETTLQGSTLLRLAQAEIFSVSVAGNHAAPADGQVVISASTGESCLDSGPPAVEGLQAGFSCELSFATPGPRSLVASFSGSASHPDSSSDSLSLAVVRMADLQVQIADGQTQTAPGDTVGHLIQLRNLGPDDAPGTALLAASSPLLQSPSWTCTPVGAAVCPSSSGTGEVQILTDLPANSGLDFVQLANAPDPLVGSLLVAVEVESDSDAPNYVHDSNQANNQASDENLSTHVFKDDFE